MASLPPAIRSAIASSWVAEPFARSADIAGRFGVSCPAALAYRPGDLPPLGKGRGRTGIKTEIGGCWDGRCRAARAGKLAGKGDIEEVARSRREAMRILDSFSRRYREIEGKTI